MQLKRDGGRGKEVEAFMACKLLTSSRMSTRGPRTDLSCNEQRPSNLALALVEVEGHDPIAQHFKTCSSAKRIFSCTFSIYSPLLQGPGASLSNASKRVAVAKLVSFGCEVFKCDQTTQLVRCTVHAALHHPSSPPEPTRPPRQGSLAFFTAKFPFPAKDSLDNGRAKPPPSGDQGSAPAMIDTELSACQNPCRSKSVKKMVACEGP